MMVMVVMTMTVVVRMMVMMKRILTPKISDIKNKKDVKKIIILKFPSLLPFLP